MECDLTITMHTLVHHDVNLQDDLSVTKFAVYFHRKHFLKKQMASYSLRLNMELLDFKLLKPIHGSVCAAIFTQMIYL